MLTARLPEQPADLGPFRALVHALGEWPLLLKPAAGAMAELVVMGATIDQAVASVRDDLAEDGITSWDRDSESDRHAAVARTLNVSLKRLEPDERAQYQRLAVFPEDEPVPMKVAAELWGDGPGSHSTAAGEAGGCLPARLQALRRPNPSARRAAHLHGPGAGHRGAGAGPG